jgi:hypothetical protein
VSTQTADANTPVIYDRTPIITVELQLRPSPPENARPYWWGVHMLDFFDADDRLIWRQRVDEAAYSSHAARVRGCAGGWVLVLTFTHDRAKHALRSMLLPDFIGPGEAGA